MQDPLFGGFLAFLADQIYDDFPPGTPPMEKFERLGMDPQNVLSNLIDVGAAASKGTVASFDLDTPIPSALLRCKGFFRPAPFLTIKANGEVTLCRISCAGEYGNIHDRSVIDILNRLQDNFVFKLHAEKRLGEYLQFVDRSVFGSRFSHGCSLRAIVSLIAKLMHEGNVSPDDKDAIHRINMKVGWLTGHSNVQW
jgi:hypothetical protein